MSCGRATSNIIPLQGRPTNPEVMSLRRSTGVVNNNISSHNHDDSSSLSFDNANAANSSLRQPHHSRLGVTNPSFQLTKATARKFPFKLHHLLLVAGFIIPSILTIHKLALLTYQTSQEGALDALPPWKEEQTNSHKEANQIGLVNTTNGNSDTARLRNEKDNKGNSITRTTQSGFLTMNVEHTAEEKGLAQKDRELLVAGKKSTETAETTTGAKNQGNSTTHSSGYTCSFRDYAEKRFYGLEKNKYPMSYLRSALYIFGMPPMLIPIHNPATTTKTTATKVCRRPDPRHFSYPKGMDVPYAKVGNVSEYGPPMDGTNPSLISISRILQEVSNEQQQRVWQQIYKDYPDAAFVVSSCFKKQHMCLYGKDLPYDSSLYPVLPGRLQNKETEILLLNHQLETILHATVQDATMYSSIHSPQAPPRTTNSTTTVPIPSDDPRIFVHDGDIWMTYKLYEDDGVTYNEMKYQWLVKLQVDYHHGHASSISSPWKVYAVGDQKGLNSGRNMAVLSTLPENLSSLTTTERNTNPALSDRSNLLSIVSWADPVWINQVDTRAPNKVYNLTEPFEHPKNKKGATSHFFGTNSFMIYVAETNEYLGLGHFHRDEGWWGIHAFYGSRYTHAFYSISANPPHKLKRLSREFLFPSQSTGRQKDADMIQFASGLEWVPQQQPNQQQRRQLAISYGINDCESAIAYVDWEFVDNIMLKDVTGEVIHNMREVPKNLWVKAKMKDHALTQ